MYWVVNSVFKVILCTHVYCVQGEIPAFCMTLRNFDVMHLMMKIKSTCKASTPSRTRSRKQHYDNRRSVVNSCSLWRHVTCYIKTKRNKNYFNCLSVRRLRTCTVHPRACRHVELSPSSLLNVHPVQHSAYTIATHSLPLKHDHSLKLTVTPSS